MDKIISEKIFKSHSEPYPNYSSNRTEALKVLDLLKYLEPAIEYNETQRVWICSFQKNPKAVDHDVSLSMAIAKSALLHIEFPPESEKEKPDEFI